MDKPQATFWLLALALLAALALAAAVAWYRGLFGPARSANALLVIAPYRHAGTWVFDDPAVGLSREPFVAGVPEMIDDMVKNIPGADQGFRLLFSAQPFPGYTHTLVWRRAEHGGNWYYCEQLHTEGWLCPAMFKYFHEAPKTLYAKAEKK
jgi:hypothetical protein